MVDLWSIWRFVRYDFIVDLPFHLVEIASHSSLLSDLGMGQNLRLRKMVGSWPTSTCSRGGLPKGCLDMPGTTGWLIPNRNHITESRASWQNSGSHALMCSAIGKPKASEMPLLPFSFFFRIWKLSFIQLPKVDDAAPAGCYSGCPAQQLKVQL